MVAIPKNAAIHIQKIAPGPPIAIAVAAPAILPVPTCAAIAVASAWKEDIPSASASPFLWNNPPKVLLIPSPKPRT